MDKQVGRRRSEPGWDKQSQGLLGLLNASKVSPQKKAVVRRKSAIGDVKVIDPKALRKDLSPERSTTNAGGLFQQNTDETSSKRTASTKTGLDDLKADNTSFFAHLSKTHFYGPDNLDASADETTTSPDMKDCRMDQASPKKTGVTAGKDKQNDEQLPPSTGLDYFAQTDKDSTYSSPALHCEESEFNSLIGFDGFSDGGHFDELPRWGNTERDSFLEGYAEAARKATEECWHLICAVYDWLIIALL